MKLWVVDDRFEEGCREATPSEILMAAAEVLRGMGLGNVLAPHIEHEAARLEADATKVEGDRG